MDSVARERRSAAEVLAWSRSVVDPALRAAIDTLPTTVWRMTGYPFDWWTPSDQPAVAGRGNALRAALALLAAEAVGGTAAAVVPAAAAVELVRNFSLIHGGLITGTVAEGTFDDRRAGDWRRFGPHAPILSGDALLTLAFDVLAAGGYPATGEGTRLLSATVLATIGGQLAELSFLGRDDVTLAECVTMAEDRTAALMGCSCALGALFGGGSPDQVDHLRGFGEHLGLAVHLVEDLLGVDGVPTAPGRPARQDLRDRRRSLPVIAALTSDTAAGRELAELYRDPAALDDAGLTRAAELVDLAGGRAWSRARLADLLAQALHRLRLAAQDTTAAVELAALARLAARYPA